MDSSTPFQPWSNDDNSRNVKSERELVDDAKLHRENVNHPKHRQTASYNKESVVDPSVVPGPSGASGADTLGGKESNMDSSKIASMQQIVENTLSQDGRQRVSHLLEAVEALSGTERLLLYLRLPTGVPPHDPLKQPMNPLGSRAELQQTVTWIQTHLEVDPDVSLPKQDVYDEYIAHCMSSNMKPLSTADFGKVMKQVYPSVRPRRLGTRGNSRYCYAGLRKKVKLEVPQLPNLGESTEERSAPSRESERIICDWAESKIGVKFTNLSELCRHLTAARASPPPGPPLQQGPEEAPGPHLMKQQLKRKLQTQSTPGRPKKNKGQEAAGESPPSTSYVSPHPAVKHESEPPPETAYGYRQAYVPVYDARSAFSYAAPPRAHPPHPHPSHPHPPPPPPAAPVHDYRPDPYAFDAPYAPRDLTLAPDATHLPINLSSDVSREASSERVEWRRRPPEPPPARLPLPGKKLILETYQSEARASSPRSSRTDAVRPQEEFPRAEYLPKKMRAAEILGGKLAAARQALAGADTVASSSTGARRALAEPSAEAEAARPEVAFLEDPKNLPNRSKSTAAALAREEQEAASPTRSVRAPTPEGDRTELRKPPAARPGGPERGQRRRLAAPAAEPDSCCGINGINIVTGIICEEKHSEILNRERVISICNIDKHDLDDYLNEGNSQEHEEELMQYFHRRDGDQDPSKSDPVTFLETGRDPHDDHSQGKSEKLSQLRELLARNLNSGSNAQNLSANQENQTGITNDRDTRASKTSISDGAFKHLGNDMEIVNGNNVSNENENVRKKCDTIPDENGISACVPESAHGPVITSATGSHLYNGNSHAEPQSPTTRTQQYEFVPISDGCHSPGNFSSKSPLGFGQRGNSPSKTNKPIMMGGSLQTSPISHSMAASPFVSPRNTPVPRSRVSQPIPKHGGRKRRNLLSLGVNDPCSKQFAIPNEQKFLPKTSLSGQNLKYCQPMSAPPSPNILSHFKHQMIQNAGIPNGSTNICLNFVPNAFRENVNGDIPQPLSADPLSSEVSQFFQEPLVGYRIGNNQSFRSQSVPLKQGTMNNGLLSYNNTPVGSVPQTPVPNEFCDFGSLADTCDLSKAGLNPETLDKIYDAIDSSNDVLNGDTTTDILSTNNTLTNGCEPLPDQPILTDEQLSSLIPNGEELLDRGGQFNESFPNDPSATNNVEEYLKRTNSIEFDLADLVTEKNKYYTSRSVPSTPLPYKRTAPNLQIDSRHSRELFTPENYSSATNGISSKSVPSTPQLAEDRNVFSYTNRDFLINGNSVDMCSSNPIRPAVDSDQALISPLDEILGPLTPAADLLADLDKIDSTPYVDL